MLSVKEIARIWGLSDRRIVQLCAAGKIEGAVKEGKYWMIPDEARIPDIVKKKDNSVPGKKQRTTAFLPCPVGITSYKEAVTECYYVDKTLFIKDILDDHSKVYLFTRPRRFGKTLMMDMVKTYFEKTEEDTSVYFKDKKIWEQDKVYQTYQAKYPVISVSFKDVHYDNWDAMYQSLCFTIKKEFRRHMELMDSKVLTKLDKKYYEKAVNEELSEVELQNALGELAYMLARHYKRKTIILIDEYDTPIQQGYLNDYYPQITNFMRNLLSAALKDNEDLEFGILTGILRVAKESLFSGLNNLFVNTILDEKYSSYFGFTEYEVSSMTQYYNKPEAMQEIKKWYDGYLFGKKEIYNPWSVLNFFTNDCQARSFWTRTSSNDVIQQLIRSGGKDLYDSLEHLLKGEEIPTIIDTDIIYPEMNGESDAIYSFLLMSGYLKVSNIISEFYDRPICNVQIPNQEIRSVFRKEILGVWGNMFTGSVLRNFEIALCTGNEVLFQKTLSDFLMNCTSSFDTAKENFYHGMILGMLSALSEDYIITSNREAGEGRFDIQLEPRDKTWSGYILEFKADKELDQTQLEKRAAEALGQIRKKEYIRDLHYRGIKNVVCFGIAFSGKKIAVKSE